MRATSAFVLAAVLAAALILGSAGQFVDAAPKKRAGAYSSVAEAREAGADFDIQGEYEGTVGGDDKSKIGVQVIALGDGAFQAVFLPGGLPGAGWDGKGKILCGGKLDSRQLVLAPLTGSRKYLAGSPDQFCATKTFPPQGQKDYTATIQGGRLTGKTDTGQAVEAKKVERKSPTLGAKPPEGATVLLPFEAGKPPSLEAWTNPKWKAMDCGCMLIVPRSRGNNTKKSFSGAWRLHVEFKTPFMPKARGQGRGNSGVFPPGGREIQVLDSFGLDGLANECGGVYKSHDPHPNMCLPPLAWQTYDVTYHPPKLGQDGRTLVAPAWYKVDHNGVTIHEKVPLGKGRDGGLSLQDHGNPVAYRNIWIVVGGEGKQ